VTVVTYEKGDLVVDFRDGEKRTFDYATGVGITEEVDDMPGSIQQG